MILWYYVYVLFSHKDAHLYIGSSNNVFRRVQQHNLGLNASTAYRRPLTLIYYEAHRSHKDALRRENYFKTTKGKVKLRSMIRSFLKDLSNTSPRV